MELRHLRAFLEIATRLHFGRAAAALHVTQPALSQRIRRLERELGVALFVTSTRGVRLTEAGRELLPHARRLVEEEERARLAIRALAAGRLRLAHYLGGDLRAATRLVAAFRERHPDVAIETDFGYSAPNVERLRSGDLDAAFVSLPMHDLEGLEVTPVEVQPFVLAVPARDPLTTSRRIDLRRIAGRPLILFPRAFNPGQYDYLVGTVQGATGVRPEVAAERASQEAMIAAVADGLGLSFCSLSRSRQLRVRGVAFRRLSGAELVAQLGLVTRREARSSPAQRFQELARELGGECSWR
jgi:DNA-binding transcriptional LysR family regulator